MEDDEANMSSNSGWKHLDSDSDSEDMIKEEIGEQIEFNGKFYTNLTKEILSKGTGPRPKQDNEVVIKFQAFFTSDNLLFDQRDDARFCIDEKKIMPSGLNLAVKTMRKGEVAKVKMQKDYSFYKDFKIDNLGLAVPACFDDE